MESFVSAEVSVLARLSFYMTICSCRRQETTVRCLGGNLEKMYELTTWTKQTVRNDKVAVLSGCP